MKVYVYFETENDLVDIYSEIDSKDLDLSDLEEKVKNFGEVVDRIIIEPIL